jgi:L-alanine-DL-glutamate epimerase-like enolase superfamily enzyme
MTTIAQISLSVFEIADNTGLFNLEEEVRGARRRWTRRGSDVVCQTPNQTHVLHVLTADGIEGICTIGDARYTEMRPRELEQLRFLAVGENAFDRERLFTKLHASTRGLFSRPGWFGAFDNCLWDIAGKASGQPMWQLIGGARPSCPCYYNFNSDKIQTAVEGALKAVEAGYPAVKDHFSFDADANIKAFEAVRLAVGPDIDILHDAASCGYIYDEAVRVGRALEELSFGWFEEPLNDRDLVGLQNLCAELDIPVLAPETLMHDVDLSAVWLRTGAVDMLRANARLGTTAILKLAHQAQMQNSLIEFNGPGGLFGLVHAHLVCALGNTSYYEYFPGGSRDERGKEIGLLNPPLPQHGHITPPTGPGWGAEWDWDYFKKTRKAVL